MGSHSFNLLLVIASVAASVLTGFSLALLTFSLRRQQLRLKTQQLTLKKQLRLIAARDAAHAQAKSLVVEVVYEDGRREELFERPAPRDVGRATAVDDALESLRSA